MFPPHPFNLWPLVCSLHPIFSCFHLTVPPSHPSLHHFSPPYFKKYVQNPSSEISYIREQSPNELTFDILNEQFTQEDAGKQAIQRCVPKLWSYKGDCHLAQMVALLSWNQDYVHLNLLLQHSIKADTSVNTEDLLPFLWCYVWTLITWKVLYVCALIQSPVIKSGCNKLGLNFQE